MGAEAEAEFQPVENASDSRVGEDQLPLITPLELEATSSGKDFSKINLSSHHC